MGERLFCFDSRKSGVNWLSAQAGLHYGISEADSVSVFDGKGKNADPLVTPSLLC